MSDTAPGVVPVGLPVPSTMNEPTEKPSPLAPSGMVMLMLLALVMITAPGDWPLPLNSMPF